MSSSYLNALYAPELALHKGETLAASQRHQVDKVNSRIDGDSKLGNRVQPANLSVLEKKGGVDPQR